MASAEVHARARSRARGFDRGPVVQAWTADKRQTPGTVREIRMPDREICVSDVHPDLDAGITETLVSLAGQTDEFKRRLRRLLENSVVGALRDDEVQDVIDLATVDEGIED